MANKGQFKKGNPGGPGRPPRETEFSLLRRFSELCTMEDFEEIVKKAVEDAKAGDSAARAFIFSYLVGKPGAVPLSEVDYKEKKAEKKGEFDWDFAV